MCTKNIMQLNITLFHMLPDLGKFITGKTSILQSKVEVNKQINRTKY